MELLFQSFSLQSSVVQPEQPASVPCGPWMALSSSYTTVAWLTHSLRLCLQVLNKTSKTNETPSWICHAPEYSELSCRGGTHVYRDPPLAATGFFPLLMAAKQDKLLR